MIEKKSFFTENNQLNKGYKSDKKPHVKQALKVDLPDASILAEYEGMQPGTIARMMEMTAKEQEHRHALDVIQLKMQKTATRAGRLFATFAVIAICYTSITLASDHMQLEAIIFAAIGFAAITISSCAGRCKKSTISPYKKPFVPHHKRQYPDRPHQERPTQNRAVQERSVQERGVPAGGEIAKDNMSEPTSNYKPHYRRRKKV